MSRLSPECVRYRYALQIALWTIGIPRHNQCDEQCCPDGSCCVSSNIASEQLRLEYVSMLYGQKKDLERARTLQEDFDYARLAAACEAELTNKIEIRQPIFESMETLETEYAYIVQQVHEYEPTTELQRKLHAQALALVDKATVPQQRVEVASGLHVQAYTKQLHAWVRGKSYHDDITNTCCPDGSCCIPTINTPYGLRKKYVAAIEQFDMLLAFHIDKEFKRVQSQHYRKVADRLEEYTVYRTLVFGLLKLIISILIVYYTWVVFLSYIS